MKEKRLGNIYGFDGGNFAGNVYDASGLCPCIKTMKGGNQQPMVMIPQATKQGYIECEIGGVVDMSFPNSKTRRGRVQAGGSVSPTITTTHELCRIEPVSCAQRTRNYAGKGTSIEVGDNTANSITTVPKDSMVLETDTRIRKLTEKECFRLMGVKDEDFEKVAKNQRRSSLYHLAGDSIVVDVLMAIFGQMITTEEAEQ